MKTQLISDDAKDTYAALIGIDWADQIHAFSLQVEGHNQVEKGTLKQRPEEISAWVAKLRERFGGRQVAIALEQSRGALIHALACYDFIVLYPVHPATASKFREAFRSSGAKSDPLDATDLLEILAKHRERLKPLNPDTEETRLLGRLVEDRRRAVDLRTGYIQALMAALKEYFPHALELVNGNLSSRLACDFLLKWPDFQAFQQAKPATIRQFYYGHNIRSTQVIERALEWITTAKELTTDRAIIQSGSRLAQMYATLIAAINPVIDDYEQQIQQLFESHPEAALFRNLPGAGDALMPRLLSFFGTDRSRYQNAHSVQSFCGIAPVTQSSGKTKVVHFRRACPHFDRQTFHEFARLSIGRCQWAANYVAYYLQKGKKYHAIIRALAFKWIRILFRCWQTRTPYNEEKYVKSLQQRGSMFAPTTPEKSC